MCLSQKNHGFDMIRMGEHIDGADTAHGVALLGEQGEVAGESFGVTGDIHDLLRPHGGEGVDEFPCAAGSRRVHEHHIRRFARKGKLLHEVARVGAVEFRILRRIAFGVGNGVLYRVAVQLNADNAARRLGGDKPYRADAAVGVDDACIFVKPRKLHRFVVELLGLNGVYLIE